MACLKYITIFILILVLGVPLSYSGYMHLRNIITEQVKDEIHKQPQTVVVNINGKNPVICIYDKALDFYSGVTGN